MDSTADKKTVPSEDKRHVADARPDVFVLPTTPCQVRYWLLNRMKSDNHALNMPLAWACRGRFDYRLAAAALTKLVSRHESLHSTFEVVEHKLSQVIYPPFEVQLPLEDLRHLPYPMRQQQADALIHQQATIRLDLERGPLFVARVIRMDETEHILLITIHHSICDGWSNGVVLREFAEIYDGLVRGLAVELPELPIQFGDFAVWLDQWRKGEESAESLEYWRETLGGDFTRLLVRRDFSDTQAEQKGEIETLLIAPELAKKAQDFCAATGITQFMLLLSVYAAMLHRLTGQGDILIGTPCANRRTETENLIGPFSNPQVIRVRMEKTDSFSVVLERVRKWALGAVAHQTLPFEDLNEDEFFSQESNQISLQVYFIYQKAFMQVQKTPSLEIVPLRSISPGTMFDLLMSIVERSEGPRLQMEYNPAYFRVSTIQRILGLYVQTLEDMLANEKSPVGEAPVQSEYGLLAANLIGGETEGNGFVPAAKQYGHLNVGMSQGAESNGRLRENHVAPRNLLEAQVATIWETAIGIKGMSVRDSFFDLGGQSLAAMRIVSRINKTYLLNFGLAVLFTGDTVERMSELIEKRLMSNDSSSLVAMQSAGSAAPLFIIHGAGGNIIRFYQLAMLIGTNHPIYGVQAQSLLSGQRALLRLEDQAAYYLDEIRKVQPQGPYYFLGYSFGGTVGLEIAHQLLASGEKVALLGMLDSRQQDYMVEMWRKDSIRVLFDRHFVRFMKNISSLSLAEKIEYLWDKLRTRTLRRLYSLAIRFGFRSVPSFLKSTDDVSWVAATNYKARPWPGRVTLFRATAQPDLRLPVDLGWKEFAQGGVKVYELPGDHDLVFQEPNIRILADQIRNCLESSEMEQSNLTLADKQEPVVVVK